MSAPSTYRRVVGLISPTSQTELCIGLDLDECLICIMPADTESVRDEIMNDPKYMELRRRVLEIQIRDVFGNRGHGARESYWGVTRPHLDTFLLFILSYFRVVFVWSAGQRLYVEAIVSKIFHGLPSPYIVLNHDDIQTMPDRSYHKPLKKVYALDPENIRPTNTFLLDNKWDNFVDNPKNGIPIPDYNPPPNIRALQNDDIALLQCRQWLLSPNVMRSKDVRTLDKSKIFITPLSRQIATSRSDFIESAGPVFRRPLNLYDVPEWTMISAEV